ncbi:unnamed protein product [Urochloa humidicola]
MQLSPSPYISDILEYLSLALSCTICGSGGFKGPGVVGSSGASSCPDFGAPGVSFRAAGVSFTGEFSDPPVLAMLTGRQRVGVLRVPVHGKGWGQLPETCVNR